jgi:hypothetical protein
VPRASIVARLRADPPSLHAGGTAFWATSWGALRWLERRVTPGLATFETGAGATTIVFAAAGAEHEAVTPAEDEIRRTAAECGRLGVDLSRVRFHLGRAEDVLPGLELRELDLVLIGGADGFPYPILDWWRLAPALRVGGTLLLDPAYAEPHGALADYLRLSPAWRFRGSAGERTALFEKLSNEPPATFWHDEPRGRPSFRYLPPLKRLEASTRHRVFTTPAGLAAVAWARRRAPRLFR